MNSRKFYHQIEVNNCALLLCHKQQPFTSVFYEFKLLHLANPVALSRRCLKDPVHGFLLSSRRERPGKATPGKKI